VKPLSSVSARSTKMNDECGKMIDAESFYFELFGENCIKIYHYRTDFSFELQIIKVFEITR
jgi:hypothetical protein